MMKQFTSFVNEWIGSGSFEREFGIKGAKIYSTSPNGEKVIITGNSEENKKSIACLVESGASTDDALGQLVAMQSVVDSVVWIATSFSEEHKNAIKWLEDKCKIWVCTGWLDEQIEGEPKMIEHE